MLIKILDEIYHELFGPMSGQYFSETSQLRLNHWQKLGDYRIKFDTQTKLPTLEYRQLDATMINDHARLQKFVDIFQYESLKYLRSAEIC